MTKPPARASISETYIVGNVCICDLLDGLREMPPLFTPLYKILA